MGVLPMPFGPPPDLERRHYSTLRDLLLMSGQARADAAERQGAIWANAVSGVGQTVAGALQRRSEEKKADAKLRDWTSFIESPESQDPKNLYLGSVKLLGMEKGQEAAQAVMAFRTPPHQDPEKELKNISITMRLMSELPDEQAAQFYPRATKRYADGMSNIGVPVERLPAEWSPESAPQLRKKMKDIAAAIDRTLRGPQKPIVLSDPERLIDPETYETLVPAVTKPAPEAKLHKVTVPGPGGVPVEKLVTEDEMKAGVRAYRAPEKPEQDKLQKVDQFNPETGETETRFITQADAMAMATGAKPGLSKGPGTAERNRMAAARASIESGEALLSEITSPEFASKLGPIVGRYNSLAAAAGAGDPQAQYLVGAIKSFAALQPQIHGFRAVEMAKDIERLLTTKQTPEALAAGLRGILTASYTVAKKKPGAAVEMPAQVGRFTIKPKE